MRLKLDSYQRQPMCEVSKICFQHLLPAGWANTVIMHIIKYMSLNLMYI